MDLNQFKELAGQYNVIPVYERITADLLTPVLAFLKIRKNGQNCFLLESVEGIGRLARYSFIGKNPVKVIHNTGEQLTIMEHGQESVQKKNLFAYLKDEIQKFTRPRIEELPDFTGGIVGFLGYENIMLVEDVIQFRRQHGIGTPDSVFGVYDTVIAFDHYKHQLILISNVIINPQTDLEKAFESAQNKLRDIRSELMAPAATGLSFNLTTSEKENDDPEDFRQLVESGKKNILAGDVFQIVLSRRFNAGYDGDLLNVYRTLRIINPSPYMYYMEMRGGITIIGTSPEDLLKVKDRKATILPIAGTRRRGKTEAEDLKFEKELLADPKEIAEHVMLVDLARNDLGRICQYDSVHVSEKMNIQRYSHVMHIVSRVEGVLREDKDCIDALMAGFPAGTLTGAPKIRAVQLIDEYEPVMRNVYGGAVGYIDFGGNLDMCIAIRTLFAKDSTVYWQAGAGIVADSDPDLELKEIKNKSAVMVNALRFAEVIDENFSD